MYGKNIKIHCLIIKIMRQEYTNYSSSIIFVAPTINVLDHYAIHDNTYEQTQCLITFIKFIGCNPNHCLQNKHPQKICLYNCCLGVANIVLIFNNLRSDATGCCQSFS